MGVTKHRKCIVQPGTQPSTDVKQEGMKNVLLISQLHDLTPVVKGIQDTGRSKSTEGRA